MLRLSLQRAYHRLTQSDPQFQTSLLNQSWLSTAGIQHTPWPKAKFIVIDCETSSLDATTGELLSLGWIKVEEGMVRYHSAHHHLLSNQQTVGQSAVIHQIRDCDLAQGESAQLVLQLLLEQMRGCILVFHHARLDLGYLNKLCRQVYGVPLLMPYIDTLALEYRRFRQQQRVFKHEELSLSGCRERYHLPEYHGHNALTDAIATAELLLAQLAHKQQDDKVSTVLE